MVYENKPIYQLNTYLDMWCCAARFFSVFKFFVMYCIKKYENEDIKCHEIIRLPKWIKSAIIIVMTTRSIEKHLIKFVVSDPGLFYIGKLNCSSALCQVINSMFAWL